MKSFKKMLFSAMMYCLTMVAHGQSDSVSTLTYEEPIQTSGFKRNESFKYLRRSMIEEPSMFKIAVLPYWSGYFGGGAHLTLGYEKKITPSFSVTGEFVNYLRLFRREGQGLLGTALNGSVRYYYGQKREIKNGVSGNNLLSNYFEIKGESILTYIQEERPGSKDLSSYPNIVLAWGMQRRIGRLAFFDIAGGAKLINQFYGTLRTTSYNETRIAPYVKISIGLGLSKKQSKKRK